MAKALGTDDSVTSCDCCGRVNLKFTVVIELDSGEIAHYGQVCAGRNTGKSRVAIVNEIKAEKARLINVATSELAASPEYVALQSRLKMRPRDLVGMAAADFVKVESDAEMVARKRIAEKYRLSGPFAFSI